MRLRVVAVSVAILLGSGAAEANEAASVVAFCEQASAGYQLCAPFGGIAAVNPTKLTDCQKEQGARLEQLFQKARPATASNSLAGTMLKDVFALSISYLDELPAYFDESVAHFRARTFDAGNDIGRRCKRLLIEFL